MWKEVKKARKEHTCECCGDAISIGDHYWINCVSGEVLDFLVYKYCDHCGPRVKSGLSWNEARRGKVVQ